jgi:ABC-type antimicrobial peptide transport system permease subunit
VLPNVAVSGRPAVSQMLVALTAALAVGAAGAFWPAWRASRIHPATALRGE